MTLCQTFRELGHLTWTRLAEAHRIGLSWSEETNTETLLLELRLRHPKHVWVEPFSKWDESLNGADWEWWLGSPGAWIAMRVQAKRLKVQSTAHFRGLQTYPGKKGVTRQINRLIRAAKAEQRTPIYCLYVFNVPPPSVRPQHPLPHEHGCLIGHAQDIRNAGSNQLSRLLPFLAPWHELVCPAVVPDAGLAARAHAQLQSMARRAQRLREQAAEDLQAAGIAAVAGPDGELDAAYDEVDDTWGEEPSIQEPQAELPDYAVRLQNEYEGQPTRTSDRIFVESRAAERRLGGIVVISSGEGEVAKGTLVPKADQSSVQAMPRKLT